MASVLPLTEASMANRVPTRAEGGRALVEVRNLVKRYGDKLVLDGLNVAIERGETVAIIGGSGCGTTTLSRLIVGLERPTSGHIFLERVDLTALDERTLTATRRRPTPGTGRTSPAEIRARWRAAHRSS
ncbi:ATP-binding cassette domain-containing protein [Pendulispora brunnea]|uniref:ATP-binding cassette domain-containing protein n=1 Tax=Pendulispora brunnea TaxID=2905690 RepID=A0ABZ2JZ52_9BACT